MNDIFINVEEEAVYPSSSSSFSPHIAYPEYKWSSSGISGSRNDVYDMVRSCLIGLGMDSANTGTEKWNPFGEFIREGDTVVIKPNWVMHFNKNKNVSENALECLFTHPSVVRPVIDYCLIALNGTGRIIVGDAPMQGCDLEELIEISGYKELFSFYNQKGLDINPVDFRQFATLVDKNKVLTGRKYNKNQGLEVDLKEKSRFSTIGSARRYKVSDYNENTTASYHNDQKHSYLINSDVISADVIINLCKPKCHRLAGITAAVKNIVGITYDKACLPHRTIGSRQDGGDEYLHRSIIKKLIAWVLAWKIKFEEQNKLRLSLANAISIWITILSDESCKQG